MSDNNLYAFVLMPFEESFNDVYQFGIKEAAKEVDINAERLDEQLFAEGMMERIYRQIEIADIIIADMTGKNANVFYEVGYAHAKDKICLLLTSNSDDIPFDLRHQRHIVYNDSINQLKDKLIENLEWAKNEIATVKESEIKVELKSTIGSLLKKENLAEGTIYFKIDLFNEAEESPVEIDAIYFYSKREWYIYQDENECAKSSSDIDGYNYRYFLNPPLNRLRENSWAQLKFYGTRVLSNVFEGDELKDKYVINGTAILRLITDKGTYDYELSFKVTLEEELF